MKKIKLTQGKVAIVDDCDYEYLNQWKWYALKQRSIFYVVRHSKKNECKKRKLIYMHRIILHWMGIKFQLVDHIDGNGLNNCRLNLRAVTTQENLFNQRISNDNTSGYKGVSWDKRNQKWRVHIQFNGKLQHLGRFDDIEEAARVYNQAAIKYFGKFARLNII